MHISLKIIQVVLLSTVKFLFAPPLSIAYGFNYWQTLLMTSTGGIAGVFLFFYLSKGIQKIFSLGVQRTRMAFGMSPSAKDTGESQKKSFTKRNKFLVRLRGRFGMIGIIVLTPTVISIPIGSFLASKYYGDKRLILVYLSVSVVAWSLLVSSLYFFHLV